MVDDVEQWRPVVGYEGAYEISDLGNMRSLDRSILTKAGVTITRSGAVKKLSPHPDGHLYVKVSRENRPAVRPVHGLVLAAFVGPVPAGLEILHRNGNGHDNRLVNLRYGTRSENTRDQVTHGRHNQASKTACHRGHEFTADNTRIDKFGSRHCLRCARIRKAAYRARQRARRDTTASDRP